MSLGILKTLMAVDTLVLKPKRYLLFTYLKVLVNPVKLLNLKIQIRAINQTQNFLILYKQSKIILPFCMYKKK